MASRPLGAQISHMLKARGVEVVFGIPGVHNQELYRGIEEAGIRHVLPRHEQGAGFMADGYARATGRPGVCYVITGPGLTNIMTPMGQAYSDSVPMLVFSSCLDETAARRGQLHQMRDQDGAARTVADWSETARTAEAAYALIDRALAEFGTGRRRPKHIQVPIGALEARAPDWPEPFPEARGMAGGRPQDADVVAGLLRAAKRPLMIFGGGAHGAALVDLLQLTGAAAFTTYSGRGVLGDRYPLNFGSFLARPGSADIIAQADLVVAIGTELAEVDLWRKSLGHRAPMVRVDIDPVSLADPQRADYPVLADARWFAGALTARLEDHRPATGWAAKDIAAARAQWRAEVDVDYPGVLPVADALRAALPADTVVYSDMTQFAYAAKEAWDLPAAGRWHHPFGFGTLGYALPAAIGGKVGLPDRPVVAIAGDYGFQYTVQELGTAVELGLSLPILLWDNGKLGAIENSMIRAQIAPNAVIARNPDFCALALAYGAFAEAPSSLAELTAAVTKAMKVPAPTLIRMVPGLA